MRLLIIGNSDAGISAALHARELRPEFEVTVIPAHIAGHWKPEVAERTDVSATSLFHHAKVDEMNALGLSYTPPLAIPWDAVQVAAQVWSAGQRKINP